MNYIDRLDGSGASIVNPPSDASIPPNTLVVFEDRIMDILSRLFRM